MSALPVEYVTDLQYTAGYYEHLAPSWMNYITALNGFPPRRPDRRFSYCELGCGQGLTAVVLAAANPQCRFWAIDANPEHVANGRALAGSCGLRNLRFLDRTIAQALRHELPTFDFIALHGVWSWVGDDVRRDIVRFVAERLKPGGILVNSYNALPGWAAVLPLREMMVAYGNHKGGSTLDRLGHGLAYVKYMADRGARYFANNPAAASKLEELMQSDARYLAHEYLNPHWKPQYFGEVLRSFKPAGLAFAGTFPLSSNYSDLSVPPAFRELMDTAGDRETFEVHRDFVKDTRFRIDYCVRTRKERSPDPLGAGYLDRFVFALLAPRDRVLQTAEVEGVKLEIRGDLFARLRDALDERPATLEELARRPELGRFPRAEIGKGLQFLVLARQVLPGLRAVAKHSRSGVSAANRALLAHSFAGSAPAAVFASPLAGAGLVFDRREALALAGVRQAGRDGAVDWCLEFLRAEGGTPGMDRAQILQRVSNLSPESIEVVSRLGI